MLCLENLFFLLCLRSGLYLIKVKQMLYESYIDMPLFYAGVGELNYRTLLCIGFLYILKENLLLICCGKV